VTQSSKPLAEPLTEIRCSALLQLLSYNPAFAVGQDERGWYWEIKGGWRCRTMTEVLENLNQWQLTANRVEQRRRDHAETMQIVEDIRKSGGVT
jgi:hypothetical protein